jgi:hypothetical protein
VPYHLARTDQAYSTYLAYQTYLTHPTLFGQLVAAAVGFALIVLTI